MTTHCVLQCKARSHSRSGQRSGLGSRAPGPGHPPRPLLKGAHVQGSAPCPAYTCSARAPGVASLQTVPAPCWATPRPGASSLLTPREPGSGHGKLPAETSTSSPQPLRTALPSSICPLAPGHLLGIFQTRLNPITDHTLLLTASPLSSQTTQPQSVPQLAPHSATPWAALREARYAHVSVGSPWLRSCSPRGALGLHSLRGLGQVRLCCEQDGFLTLFP